MPDVIVFRPKAELDATSNLAGFVESCRRVLTVFGADLNFDGDVWDVTDALGLKGHGKKRSRLVFSTLATVNDKSPMSMGEPFLSFAKGYMRYMHGLRPTKAIGFRLSALRALEAALAENGVIPNPVRTDAGILNRAAQLIGAHYTEMAAYRIGGQLEMVAKFLAENRLTLAPVRWKNHIKRPRDSVRVGKEFDERRQAKMPSQAALEALPKVFLAAIEPPDVLVSSIAAILCSAPDRISELLLLPDQCEVHDDCGRNNSGAYGLRWWPAKGAEPMIKWIVPSMTAVVQDAIAKIRTITAPAREIAKWYEAHPEKLYLDRGLAHLRSAEWLTMKEAAEVLGLGDTSAARAWCRSHEVKANGVRGEQKVRFGDVERAVIAMLPQGFPVLDPDTGLRYGDALLVVRTNEMHPQRGTYRCMVEPITINQINTGLGTRAQHGFSSIFSRLGFTEQDGSPIKVTSHQFRHYLNTLAQIGGMSQLDIAKWSGRKDVRQNSAYNHVTPDQMLQKIREAVGDDSQMFGPLAKLPDRVLIPRDEFATLRVPTAHTTDLGFCIHDYTMSPCQLHRDCIHCEDLVCIKGDKTKTLRIRQSLEEARALLQQAEKAMDDDYAGSDRWFQHQVSAVERLTQLCSIMEDPNVPNGAVVQLQPPQQTAKVLGTTRNHLLPARPLAPTEAALLAELVGAKAD